MGGYLVSAQTCKEKNYAFADLRKFKSTNLIENWARKFLDLRFAVLIGGLPTFENFMSLLRT